MAKNVVACTKTQKHVKEELWKLFKEKVVFQKSYTVRLMIITSEDEVEISTTSNDTGSNSSGKKEINGYVLWK